MHRLLSFLLVMLLPIAAHGSDDFRDLGAATKVEMKSEKRVALVIGNGGYHSGALRNPPNDARAMATKLRALGFAVTLETDLDQNAMKKAIIYFGRELDAGGVGLFYYAGHGIQHNGRNYLVPVGAEIENQAYIDVMAVDVNLVLAGMDAAQNRLNIVVLDACRNNPFASSFRSQSRGLAQLNAPTGTFIAFATGPGDVAEDGSGSNSSFTSALVRRLDSPGAKLEEVFKDVRRDVYEATGGRQTTWTNNSVMVDFYFSMAGGNAAGSAPAPEVTPDPSTPAVSSDLPPRSEVLVPTVIDSLLGSDRAIKRCFVEARARSEPYQGKVWLKFTVDPSGAIRDAFLTEAPYAGTELERCVADRAERLSFEAFDGVSANISYPFVVK